MANDLSSVWQQIENLNSSLKQEISMALLVPDRNQELHCIDSVRQKLQLIQEYCKRATVLSEQQEQRYKEYVAKQGKQTSTQRAAPRPQQQLQQPQRVQQQLGQQIYSQAPAYASFPAAVFTANPYNPMAAAPTGLAPQTYMPPGGLLLTNQLPAGAVGHQRHAQQHMPPKR